MTRTFCKILGFVLLIVGIAGFAMPNLLGMHLTPVHNVIHLLSAALALYFGYAASLDAARTFCWAFGAVYLLLGVLGFVAPSVVAGLLGHTMDMSAGSLTPDNIVHLLLGALFLVAAVRAVPTPRTRRTTT
jgi:hypothetical protein